MARLLTLSRDAWSADLIHDLDDDWPTSAGLWLGRAPLLLGPPPARFDEIDYWQLPGVELTATTHGARDIVLPVVAIAADTDDLEAIAEAFALGVDPIYSATPVRITYTRTGTAARWIDAVLIGGGPTVVDDCETRVARWRLAFRAPWPYWTDGADRTTTTADTDLTADTTGWSAGAVAWSDPAEWFSAPDADDVTAAISSDLPVWPRWELDGPATRVAVLNPVTGEAWRYSGTVATGQTLVIDTAPGGCCVEVDGVAAWAGLDSASVLFTLGPDAAAAYAVAIDGAAAATELRMVWRPSWLSC